MVEQLPASFHDLEAYRARVTEREGEKPIIRYEKRWKIEPGERLADAWDSLEPDQLLSIKLDDTDLYVVDVDDQSFAHVFDDFLTTTFVVRTKRGYHFYFKGKGDFKHRMTKVQGLPIDVLGSGMVNIKAGENVTSKSYEIISNVEPATVRPETIIQRIPKPHKRWESIERVKSVVKMEDVLERYGIVALQRGNYKFMHCEFHDDHIPSAVINENNVYCFACQKSWDIFEFIKEKEGYSTIKEALDKIREWFPDKVGRLPPLRVRSREEAAEATATATATGRLVGGGTGRGRDREVRTPVNADRTSCGVCGSGDVPSFLRRTDYCFTCLGNVLWEDVVDDNGRIDVISVIRTTLRLFSPLITIRNEDVTWFYNHATGTWTEADSYIREFLSKTFNAVNVNLSAHRKTFILDEIKSRTYVERHRIRRLPPEIIPLKNGFYDVKTETFYPGTHSPRFAYEHFFTTRIPHRYVPFELQFNSKEDQFDFAMKHPIVSWFRSVVRTWDEANSLIQWIGYCMYRDYPIQKFLIVQGGGSNGKGTYLRLIEEVLGSHNVVAVPMHRLANGRFEIAQLSGKLANLAGETKRRLVKDVSIIKEVTGNNGVYIDEKFKKGRRERITAKFIFASNRLPKIDDETFALWRRMHLIVFPYTFKQDPGFEDWLLTEENLEVVVWLALNALHELIEKKEFAYNPDYQTVMDEYYKLTDPFEQWLDEEVYVSHRSDDYIPKMECYEAYKEWCIERGEGPISYNYFCRKLLAKGISSGKRRLGGEGRLVPVFTGIILAREEMEEREGTVENFFSFQ